jgi:hypothetical protein
MIKKIGKRKENDRKMKRKTEEERKWKDEMLKQNEKMRRIGEKPWMMMKKEEINSEKKRK